ncbi:MAG: alkaline shock response membrane anchor protein AmaP [Bacillota bacterium]
MHPLSPTAAPHRVDELKARLPIADRLLVLLTGLLVMAAGFTALAMGLFGWDGALALSTWVSERALQGRVAQTVAGAVLALLGAAALRPALSPVSSERSIVRATGLGEVHISLRAIQTLARRAAAQVQGIREVEVQIQPSSTGDVNVQLALTVAPDQSIPELCDEVQARIDQYLRQTAGVSCGQIKLMVRGISREAHRSRPD